MDSEVSSPLWIDMRKCSYCRCSSSLIQNNCSSTWPRFVKRKLDEFEDGGFVMPALDYSSTAHVDMENECAALRGMVSKQQHSIEDLCLELEEERSASASAANETMSMILRLQREKAEIQMEARQFKRFTEEKMLLDQEEILALEDFLYKREQEIQSLAFEVQAYKHRMLSYGLTIAESGEKGNGHDCFDYPPLKCNVNKNEVVGDIGKHEAPEIDDLTNLEHRICQMERGNDLESEPNGEKHVLEKFIVHQSLIEESLNMKESYPLSETGDDGNDRVCTIDSIHERAPSIPVREPKYLKEDVDSDIKHLHMRLQALEADRESMRQEIISMRTDKAQMFLLREIAQKICKGQPQGNMPIRKEPLVRRFSLMGILKWIMSFIFWRRGSGRNKQVCPVGLSCNMGLLILLDKGPQARQWGCLTYTSLNV